MKSNTRLTTQVGSLEDLLELVHIVSAIDVQ